MPDSSQESPQRSAPDVQVVDLTAPLHVVHGRLPAIDAIQDRFARELRADLFRYMHYGVQVSQADTRLEQHDEVMHRFTQPSLIEIVTLHPLRGFSVVAVDGGLVGAVVDRLCGADVPAPDQHAEEFSPLENRLARHLLDIVGGAVTHAWRGIQALDFNVARVERNPSFIAIADAREQLITTRVQLSLATGSGEVVVAIPYSAIEPVRDKLSTAMTLAAVRSEDRARWHTELMKTLDGAEISLRAELMRLQLPARTVSDLAVGQILSFHEPHKATVYCGEAPLFAADFGALNNNVVVRVDEFVTHKQSERGDDDGQPGRNEQPTGTGPGHDSADQPAAEPAQRPHTEASA